MTERLRIGFLVNPVAGIGGRVGLKGSDGEAVQAQARRRGGIPRSAERAKRALESCAAFADRLSMVTWGGAMGGNALESAGFDFEVAGTSPTNSSAEDTRTAARALLAAGIDLMIFVGGDGTARDLCDALGTRVPVLGVPSGVKMHSGVFATRPSGVGEVLKRVVDGGLVAVRAADVRDLDEAALRAGKVASRYYGELKVPEVGGFLQHVKEGGVEREDLVVEEIAADISERAAERGGLFLFGPGSTVAAIEDKLVSTSTLLGVDAVIDGRLVGTDLAEQDLVELTRDREAILVVSFTRGQGALFGRGNLQISPRVLAKVSTENVWVVGSRTKLKSLGGRPLFVDTGDDETDRRFAGVIEITAAYEDRLLYRVTDDA